VTIEVPTSSRKWVQAIGIQINGVDVNGRMKQKVTPGTTRILTLVIEPPREVVGPLHVTARLRYKNLLKENWRSPEALISVQELMSVAGLGATDRKEWRGTYEKWTVIVGLTTRVAHPMQRAVSEASSSVRNPSLNHEERALTPTTESILRVCPRFRILVMGKTGVGKSRLINETFGVDDANVAHNEVGRADIDKEIYSKANPHFILHDSKGFEHGDDVNVKIVQRFINERSKEPLIKDKLHAVWLCIDIPRAGGRLLESGIENFLKLKIEGKLSDVPVIVVFTKYDLLVGDETLVFKDRSGKSKEAIAKQIELNARTILDEICVQPFDSFVEKKVPHVTVSEYWERLATNVNFPGKKLQQCLDVIHTDIIAVWQFDDPQDHLSSSSFKALMSNIVSGEGGENKIQGDPGKNLAFRVASISLVAGIAGIVGAVSGPAAPIVIPIAAAFVLAKWAYDVYQQTAVVLRLLMSYIVDLTLVLQNVFWLHALICHGQPLSRRIIKAGARVYYESNAKQTILFKIDEHLKGLNFNVGPDTTLNTIAELIKSYTINENEAEMLKQGSHTPGPEDVAEDEAWDS
ncbi:hypothetical protein DXG01_016478, partial [Tephrocybe rancida]